MATATNDLNNLNVGVCKVVIDPDAVAPATPIIIELTTDDVKYSCKQNTVDITLSQTGKVPVDVLTDGVEAEIELPIALYDLDLIKTAFPANSTKTTNATTSTSKVTVGSQAGVSMAQFAKKVRIEPINGTVEDHITLLKAIPVTDLSQTFALDKARALTIKFRALPDLSQTGYPTVEYGDGTVV